MKNRLNKCRALILIGLVGMFIIGGREFVEASSYGKEVGITIIDGTDKTTPDIPDTENPSVDKEKESTDVNSEGSLPSTGEKKNGFFLILGIVILISVVAIVYFKRKQ